ncbi:interleukin-15 receptor subunit alpha-like isoform X1 [Heptranchias perlo]|uniref:interleukin-15 receptor subunit alpha-like isoform X1 n=1 Tax=Heptranchias perlo TaxID=212740 RepID=UPI00355A3A2E
MAWIQLLLLLWSIFQTALAPEGRCSKPDFKVDNVDMSEIMDMNFQIGRRLRLKCQSGYKRKAGTSNLIRCQNNSKTVKWSQPNLTCIRAGGTQPPVASTSSAEIPKDLTPTVHDTPGSHLFKTLTPLATSVEPTTLATSVEQTTSAVPARSLSDHNTTSTVNITVTSGSHLSPAMTTLTTASVESTTLTATTKSLSGRDRTSSVPPVITGTSGLGPLATTWTAVRPSTPIASTAKTEFPAAVVSHSTQRAAAETTVTYSTNRTTGTEPITTRKSLAERTVKSSTATETAADVTSTIGTADINQTVTAGRNIGLIIGTSSGSVVIIMLCVLVLVWSFVLKNKISCTGLQVAEHELAPMAPMELPTVTNTNETEPLQQETKR